MWAHFYPFNTLFNSFISLGHYCSVSIDTITLLDFEVLLKLSETTLGRQQKSAVGPNALAHLQGIFPVKSNSVLQSALDTSDSLEDAIDQLLETGQ